MAKKPFIPRKSRGTVPVVPVNGKRPVGIGEGRTPQRGLSVEERAALNEFLAANGMSPSGEGRTYETLPSEEAANVQQSIGTLKEQDGNFFSQMLANVGENSDTSHFLEQILGIGAGNTGWAGTYTSDLQKKLLEMLLDNIVKNEQRSFDQNALAEQRLYDSPTNQLLRLMSTGMSRDAALQAIQGVGESPLVGSGAEVTAGEPLPSPTQTVQNAVNSAIGLISTVGNLVSLGFSIPASIEQIHMLKNANFLTDSQNRAAVSVGKAMGIVTAAGKTAESIDSVGALAKTMSELATSGNVSAAQFISSGEMQSILDNSAFTSPALSQHYTSEQGANRFREELRLTKLRGDLTNANVEQTYQDVMTSVSEMLKNYKIIEDLEEQIGIHKEQKRVAKYEGDFADFQGQVLDAALGITDDKGRGIVQLMSGAQFNEMWEHFENIAAKVEKPDDFRKFLRDNQEVAFTLAACEKIATSKYADYIGANSSEDEQKWYNTVLQFFGVMQHAGVTGMAKDAISLGISAYKAFHPASHLMPQ